MSEIKKLDPLTASKIAAGEVVDKPLNVVKELMENSLDAGASSITIELSEGGLELIRITDDGHGISYEDLPLAVERFATSKVSTVEDVYNVSTFGFRGEALAAVSSVSRFIIKSIKGGSEAGEFSVEFGQNGILRPGAISKGTQVTAARLFDNIPVRKKFLRSQRSSEGEITKFVKQFSAINHGINIILMYGEKEVFRSYSASSMLDVAKYVFNEDKLRYSECIFDKGTTVNIVVSHPSVQRRRKDSIFIGVNGRVVKDLALVQAVLQAYHRIMPHDCYPMAIVDVRIDPSFLDVNIHPTKSEVRFVDSNIVFHQVKKATEEALSKFTISVYAESDENEGMEFMEAPKPKVSTVNISQEDRHNPFAESVVRPQFDLTKEFTTVTERFEPAKLADNYVNFKPLATSAIDRRIFSTNKNDYIIESNSNECKALAQLSKVYILCEMADTLVIIDQHVAHERVLYEKYKNDILSNTPSITLFEPIIINLQAEEIEFVSDVEKDFGRFGYGYEVFGPESIKLTRAPVDILKKNVTKEFVSIVHNWMENKKHNSRDAAIITMSCRNAVKAGDKMNIFEMQELVNALFKTVNPHTCPHGRPIIYSISASDLAKKFHRQ